MSEASASTTSKDIQVAHKASSGHHRTSEPRKPKEMYRGKNGFADTSPLALEPMQVAQFALDYLGSSFPTADQLRATGRQEYKTAQSIKSRIDIVKMQQKEELERAYQYRNTEYLDLLQQQRLCNELDSVPTSTVLVSKITGDKSVTPVDEFLTMLSHQRHIQEHASDDLVDRLRYSHLKTLQAWRAKQAAFEKFEIASRPAQALKFPQSPEEFISMGDMAAKLRIAKYLKASPESQGMQAVQNGWEDEVVPLMRAMHFNLEFREAVEKIIKSAPNRDPRLRR